MFTNNCHIPVNMIDFLEVDQYGAMNLLKGIPLEFLLPTLESFVGDKFFICAEYGGVIAAGFDVKEFVEINLINSFVCLDRNFPVKRFSWSYD